MKLLLYCLLGIVCPVVSAFAQSPPANIKPLNIGDTIPLGFELTNVYNYPVSKIRLSDLKGKYIILDLWSTWCSSCIAAFPKMLQLQKEFGDQLQVILVNTYQGDSVQKVQSLFQKQKVRTGYTIDLPYSLQQSTIFSYFPHRTIPHYVWIDNAGKVVAQTSLLEVTRQNVLAFLQNNLNAIHQKKDITDFDRTKPLFVDNNGGNGSEFWYRSILTGYIEGIGYRSGMEVDSVRNVIRFYQHNQQFRELLRTAYPTLMNRTPNRILLELKDPSKFRPSTAEDTLLFAQFYCYEAILPRCNIDELRYYIKQDVERFLRVCVEEENRLVRCLVLRKKKDASPTFSNGGQPDIDLDKYSAEKYIRNFSISSFIEILNGRPALQFMPVLDETGIDRLIDIDFPYGFLEFDLAAIKHMLNKNGFETVEEDRIQTVTVIKDK